MQSNSINLLNKNIIVVFQAYCAILYLRPRMKIVLRSKTVRTTIITKSLSKTEVDYYRPSMREAASNTSTLVSVSFVSLLGVN